MTLEERRKRGIDLRKNPSGYSHCFRCGIPWNHCKAHSTHINKAWGCFPLCEDCWSECTPQERLPYYRQLFNEHELLEGGSNYSWEATEYAVLNEGNFKSWEIEP